MSTVRTTDLTDYRSYFWQRTFERCTMILVNRHPSLHSFRLAFCREPLHASQENGEEEESFWTPLTSMYYPACVLLVEKKESFASSPLGGISVSIDRQNPKVGIQCPRKMRGNHELWIYTRGGRVLFEPSENPRSNFYMF